MNWLLTFAPVFNPLSAQADSISRLFVIILGICLVIFTIVAAMVFIGIFRFRHKPGDPDPKPVFGNVKIEIVWTTIPFLLLIWIFFLTAEGMKQSDPPVDRGPDLLVVSHQWWWEVRYLKTGAVTANEIHIPVGAKWLVRLESADVIHDFWVPQLGPKIDAVPGHPNRLWLQADQPGSYMGICSQYCGVQHAWMRFSVIAQSPENFEAWQKQQLQPPAALTQAALPGAKLFQKMTCSSCHSVRSGQTVAAPDLTHFASRGMIGGGVLANNSENLAAWLSNPQAFKPGTLMPNLNLTQSQVADLVNYLEALR